mgnify:CR=1 FL=1
MEIKIKGIIKTYEKFKLNILKLQIKSGEIFGLVGNNGAGKTTFLRLCLDLIQADSGKVLSNNMNVAKNENWKKYTGSYLDEGFLIDFLTPEEYFDFMGSLHEMTEQDIQKSLSRFKTLFYGNILGQNKYIRDMSTGNKNKVGIAAAMLFYPDVILLDEPFANLDPTSRKILNNLLIESNQKRNTTIIVSSHDIANVADLCTRIAILEEGQIVRDIKTSDKTYKELQNYFEIEKLESSKI